MTLNERIEETTAEYAAWAGNDLTTANFKRLQKAIKALLKEEYESLKMEKWSDPGAGRHFANGYSCAVQEFNQKLQDKIKDLDEITL